MLSTLEDLANNREFKLDEETMEILNRLASKNTGFWSDLPLPVKILLVGFLSVGSVMFIILSVTGVKVIKRLKLDEDYSDQVNS